MKIETQKRGYENSKFPSCIPSLPPAAPCGLRLWRERDEGRAAEVRDRNGDGTVRSPERSEGAGRREERGRTAERGNHRRSFWTIAKIS